MLTFHNHNLFSLKAMDEEVNIYPCGVVISPWSPWLAATPDRKVFCPSLDPPHGLLEIKCPVNSLADCVYLSKDENGYHLKETQILPPDNDTVRSNWAEVVSLLCVDT